MRCYFLRHGIAAEAAEWQGTDFDRPLTDAGRERMTREAKTMAEMDLDVAVILTSPLVRARQTAAIVAKELKLRDRVLEDARLGLDFGLNRLASILEEHRDDKAIMLVGHEPGMSRTIGQVAGGARIDFKKGSLACVNLLAISSLDGELVWLIPGKVLARR